MLINYRVARDFADYSDPVLDEFANHVAESLIGNPAFPNPPITPPALALLVTAFRNAIQAAQSGGPTETALKNAAREALVDALRKLANYVQTEASHDLAKLLSSGFLAVSTNRAQSQLDQPVIVSIENLETTKLLLRLLAVENARSFQAQISVNGTGVWLEAGIYTQARRIVLSGLTPGTVYNVRVRAIGGSTGYSEWSVPVSLMST